MYKVKSRPTEMLDEVCEKILTLNSFADKVKIREVIENIWTIAFTSGFNQGFAAEKSEADPSNDEPRDGGMVLN